MTIERRKDMKTIRAQTDAFIRILKEYPKMKEYVVGFDVANSEQMKIPIQFREIFEKLKEYNKALKANSEAQVGITFHAGEDFEDISIESGIRHVHEVIDLGANRIGHGLVLGIDVEQFQGTERKEHITERIAQIYYDLKCARFDSEGIARAYLSIDTRKLIAELDTFSRKYKYVEEVISPAIKSIMTEKDANKPSQNEEKKLFDALLLMKEDSSYTKSFVIIKYDKKRCEELFERQNYVLNKIIEKRIVIETNPTSNVCIGPIASYGKHPILRWLLYSYPAGEPWSLEWPVGHSPIITVNTDDSGVFGTTLVEEFVKLAVNLELAPKNIKDIIINGFKYRLSGHPLRFHKQIVKKLGPEIEEIVAPMLWPEDETEKPLKFEELIEKLKSLSRSEYHEYLYKLEQEIASSTASGQSIILYADDILKSTGIIDLESSLKSTKVSGLLENGKIVIFACEENNGIFLEKLIKKANPEIETLIITQRQLYDNKTFTDKGPDETKALIEMAKAKGAQNILTVIRGLPDKPEKLAKVAENFKIPIVFIGQEDALYSFAQALYMAIFIRTMFERKIKVAWSFILPTVKLLTPARFKQYQRSLNFELSM